MIDLIIFITKENETLRFSELGTITYIDLRPMFSFMSELKNDSFWRGHMVGSEKGKAKHCLQAEQ